MDIPDTQTLMAGAVIAAVAAMVLALPFGMSRRTVLAAVAIAAGINAFYPGGATALVDDAIRPFGAFLQHEKALSAKHDAAVGEAADGHAPARPR